MFTPTQVKHYSAMMVMTLQETGKDVYSLPILAKAVVPRVSLLTPQLSYGHCFLEYPYTLEAELMNDSNLPVKYEVATQKDKAALQYSTPCPSGIVNAHTVLKLPLEIRPKVQGEISTNIPIHILHSTEAAVSVDMRCIGEGPVVYVTPSKLKWGVCPVLTAISKTVTLANQSVIPAEFECALVS